MVRSGGPSTATGVSFQALAIARRILDVHQGLAESVRAEVPPQADFGETSPTRVEVDDYVVQYGGRRVYYQAKSNAPGGGSWTLSKLLSEDILPSFVRQLSSDPDAECCLVTPCSCSLLAELAPLAVSAVSVAEYVENLGKKKLRQFEDTRRGLQLTRAKAYEVLRRCRLEIRSSKQLTEDLESLAHTLFADPKAAVDCLFALANQAMTRSRPLCKAAIDAYFADRAAFAKPPASEAELLAAVAEASSRLRSVDKVIGGSQDGIHLLQPTVGKAMDWIREGSSRKSPVAAILDQAGSGKTVAMSVLLHRLEKAGYVVLGIKVDGLSFTTADELTAAIGLPAPITSTVQSLRAYGHKVAVLIDQVDALSSAISRNAAAITVVLDLVARLSHLVDVPTILACRSFDWRYDVRIRALRAHSPMELSLPELSDEQLEAALSAFGVQKGELHPLTVGIIRCPLRLKLLVEVLQAQRDERPEWSPASSKIYTLQSLYDEFWNLKLRKAAGDGIQAAACENVVAMIAERMHATQELSVPLAMVAGQTGTVDWLTSEGVLAAHGKSIVFFHQTFFDFVYARRFVARSERLLDELLGSDQGLFYRPMVRQILEYKRDTACPDYLTELRGVLKHPEIRQHLRWLVIAWVGQLPDPRPEELSSVEPFLADPQTLGRTLGLFRGNQAWFHLLGEKRLRSWLESFPVERAGAALWYVDSLLPDQQERAASLLTPYVGRSEQWNLRVAWSTARVQVGWSDCWVELLKQLLRSPLTKLDQGRNSLPHCARALEALAKDRPQKACEALSIILERFLPRWSDARQSEARRLSAYATDDTERLLPEGHSFNQSLISMAERAPGDFLNVVVPWTLDCMNATCEPQGEGSFRDSWALWRYEHPHPNTCTGRLLSAIEAATRWLARTAPDAFRRTARALSASDFAAMQCIVADACGVRPDEYARDAGDFLCADTRRLRLAGTGSTVSLSAELIRACRPHWSAGQIALVEKAILSLPLPGALGIDGLNCRGIDQLELLRALGRESLSQEGANLLGQLERKFPHHRAPEVRPSGLIRASGPPIPGKAIQKMDEDAWLGAMRTYGGQPAQPAQLNGINWDRITLARALKDRTKEEPARFLRFAMDRMDETFHADYVGAIVEGVAEAHLPIADFERLVVKFLPVFGSGNVRQLAWAIDKYAETGVTPGLVSKLKEWALYASAPSATEGDRLKPSDGHSSFYEEGINTDRGAAVRVLASVLLKAEPSRQMEYLGIAEQVASDDSLAVRAVCLEFLHYAIPADASRACALFRMLTERTPMLLREGGAYDFVYYSLRRAAREVLWAIETMLQARDDPLMQEHGAKLACLAAFTTPEAHVLRDTCLRGSAALRSGAAVVYATNITDRKVGEECQKRLLPLMDDDNPKVREAAVSFIGELDRQGVTELRDLLLRWSKSKSIEEGADDCGRMLEKHPTADTELTLTLSERLVHVLGAEVANIQTRHGGISYELTPAILNVYQWISDCDDRRRAIDLLERLEELGCTEVTSALEAVDRL